MSWVSLDKGRVSHQLNHFFYSSFEGTRAKCMEIHVCWCWFPDFPWSNAVASTGYCEERDATCNSLSISVTSSHHPTNHNRSKPLVNRHIHSWRSVSHFAPFGNLLNHAERVGNLQFFFFSSPTCTRLRPFYSQLHSCQRSFSFD